MRQKAWKGVLTSLLCAAADRAFLVCGKQSGNGNFFCRATF